jgi:cytochrome b561
MALAGLAGGVAVGAILGVVGLRLTRFERTAEGWFYTPNAHIGIALSALFTARVAWRLVQLQLHGAAPAAAPGGAQFASSPLTLVVFGMLAGYYTVYAAGLLRWRRSGS